VRNSLEALRSRTKRIEANSERINDEDKR